MTKNSLLTNLQHYLPDISFSIGDSFFWSPREQTITHQPESTQDEWSWALLHEAGHASLGHKNYTSDVELLLLESAAWDEAKRIGKTIGLSVDDDHIQDCLDTYRDWLHKRSTCPKCSSISLQNSANSYKCINCSTSWQVSGSRFCRPYRLSKLNSNKKSPALAKTQATFR